MFIDLKNGTCINSDEVMGATFGKQSGAFIVSVTMKPFNQTKQLNMAKPASINIKFTSSLEANKYIEKYFNIESYFD